METCPACGRNEPHAITRIVGRGDGGKIADANVVIYACQLAKVTFTDDGTAQLRPVLEHNPGGLPELEEIDL